MRTGYLFLLMYVFHIVQRPLIVIFDSQEDAGLPGPEELYARISESHEVCESDGWFIESKYLLWRC